MPQRKTDAFDRWWPRLRDVGCSVLGGYLVVAQSLKTNPSESILATGAMILVVPAAALAQRWVRGRLEE